MAVEVSNIRICRGGRTIIEGVSLTARAGQFVAIAGVNGSGKSTLLGGITGEVAYQDGTIHIAGRALEHWPLNELAKLRAVLRQESDLSFPFSVLDVVLMGRSIYNRGVESVRDLEIAHAALMHMEMEAFKTRSYMNLSGGERQRVHFSRALAQVWPDDDPLRPAEVGRSKYLFLDEPTASQDLAGQHKVLGRARAFANAGGVVISVLHDLNQVFQYADLVVLLADGRVEAHGPPQDVLTAPCLERVYQTPIRLVTHPDASHPLILSGPAECAL